jgi:16S rRNA (guanine527-N7)-methyltransferase
VGRGTPPYAAHEALAELAQRFGLPAGAETPLGRLVELLSSDPLAPTAVRAPIRILEDHLADSLVALELDGVRSAVRVADLGSGAGLPGLPLAVALPHARFALVESNRRKAAFIARAVETCHLTNAEIVAERAENWRTGLGSCDLVTVRAVAELDTVAEYAAPLLTLGGRLVVWRGKRDAEAEARGRRAAEILGLRVQEPAAVQPFPAVRHRYLHVMLKVTETPDRFPRRPGLAGKRPLGLRA